MLEEGGVKVLWSSLHIPEREYFECWLPRLVSVFSRGGRAIRKLSSWECLRLMKDGMEFQVARAEGFELARSNAELDDALSAGNTAIVHTIEGGHVLGAGLEPGDEAGRLARVDELADWGVASLTLAHLFPNELAGHANAIPPKPKVPFCDIDPDEDLDRGLEPVGRAVVERMVERRMVPDVSHCAPVARRQVYELVGNRIPVVATHTGVRSLRDVPYNLDRDDVAAIVATGGVVGVIFMPYWLEEGNPGPGREAIWRTMDQIREWSGGSWDHVAVGTDFDGFTDPPDDVDCASKLPEVRAKLEEEGLSESEMDAVLGGNARRVLRDGWQ
jgi:membrane dipeptidase